MMKIWYGYGTEHSANLVMIGRFKEAKDATKVKEILARMAEQVRADEQAGLIQGGIHTDRFSDEMLELLRKLRVHSVGPGELEQFVYDVNIEIKPGKMNELVLTTEETDVSAFLKVLIDNGARIEVYSAHDYPDSEHGRGK